MATEVQPTQEQLDSLERFGQQVRRGIRLGWPGNTADSTGAHLHFEPHGDDVLVDPTNYLV